MVRYDVFEQLEELTKLVKRDDISYGYSKMIQTGNLTLQDYGRGYLELTIFYSYHNSHYVCVRCNNIDDGSFVCDKLVDSPEAAKALIDKVATQVFKDMVKFPTDDELNIMLRIYGIHIFGES